MKLSVITINLNNANGLLKTINSVLDQTWSDFEFIIIDGASTDNSLEIIKTFEYKRSDITYKWISEPDSGVYQAMNKGIGMSKGEYMLFLNSGDFLVDDNVLKRVFEDYSHTTDIICARCDVSDKGIVVWTSNPPQYITFGTLYYQGLAHQSTFIKRQLFHRLGYYREDFRYNSDIEFWYRAIILNNASTYTIKEIVSDYNLDGISSNENTSQAYKREMKEILSLPILQRFIPDYENWKKEQQSLEVLYWIKSKAIFYQPMHFIFNVIKQLKNK